MTNWLMWPEILAQNTKQSDFFPFIDIHSIHDVEHSNPYYFSIIQSQS